MKKLSLLLALVGILSACAKNEDETNNPDTTNTSFEAQYQLREILADPGDGSGTFKPVNSAKIVMLYADGTIKCNGDLCNMSEATGTTTQGTYTFSDSSITVNNCMKLFFELSSNGLIINYPCIEPCRAKYEKIPLAVYN